MTHAMVAPRNTVSGLFGMVIAVLLMLLLATSGSADENAYTVYYDRDGGLSDDVTTLTVAKLDRDTHEQLSGARLSVIEKKTGAVVQEWTSDEAPHEILGGLNVDTAYILRETSAPDGYDPAADVEFVLRSATGGCMVELVSGESIEARIEIGGQVGTATVANAETFGSYGINLYDGRKATASESNAAPYGLILEDGSIVTSINSNNASKWALKMNSSAGGSFWSRHNDLTFTIEQVCPDNVDSLIIETTLDKALQFVSSADNVRVINKWDGSTIQSARISLDGQHLTVVFTDVSSLFGMTIDILFDARVRDDVNLEPYTYNDDLARIPYNAQSIFVVSGSGEQLIIESGEEVIKIPIGRSGSSSSVVSGQNTSTSVGTTGSIARTGDGTSYVPFIVGSIVGIGLVAVAVAVLLSRRKS